MALNKKVLILDDEPINNKLIAKLLANFGLQSASITDPTKIFAALEMEQPDLLLLDLMMPVQDGFSTLKLIKEHEEYHELPVIILSGETGEDILALCLKNGAVDYLTKPVRKLELEARVSSAIKIAELNRNLNNKLNELQDFYQRTAEELEIARKIQLSIVGPQKVTTPIYEIASHMEIANRLGGDFFDIKQKDNLLIGTIADVSGHGVSSSLIVMMLKTLLNSFAIVQNSPAQLLNLLHTQLFNTIPKGFFIAMSHFVFDTETNILKFSNAGLYDAIVLRQNGSVEEFGSKSFAVAFIARADFKELEITLHSGDSIVFHTDGINEAVNEKSEMYSRQRVLQVLSKQQNGSAGDLLEAILMDRKLFIGETIPEDDSTIMVLSIK